MSTAADFLGALGVNTHLNATTTSYGDVTLVASALAYLGIGIIRDHAYDTALPAFARLATAGVHFDLIADDINPGLAVDTFAPLASSIVSFEGANEVDIYPVAGATTSGPVKAAVLEQQVLYSAVRSRSDLAAISVLNESIGDPANTKRYAAAAASSDLLNVHAYANSGPPLAAILATMRVETAGSAKGVAITETGYDTLSTDPQGVDEITQASYTLDTLFDTFSLGITHTYLYELLDQRADPARIDPQLHYGLFHADGSPKLAATGIHNLTTLLASPGLAGAPPISLAPTVAGLPTTGHSLTLAGATGAAFVAVWSEPDIWDPATQTNIPVASTTVTVDLGTTAAIVSIYDPLVGATPIATYANQSQISVAITDHPIIIEAQTAAAPPAPPPVATTLPDPAIIAAAAAAASIPSDPLGGVTNTTAPASSLDPLLTERSDGGTPDGLPAATAATLFLAVGDHAPFAPIVSPS